jgi:myosin heavy subunit
MWYFYLIISPPTIQLSCTGQLDQAASQQAQAVRDVQRLLDSAEAEVSRLKDRLADREVKEEALNTRIKSHERELVRLQEAVFKRDRQIREEQEKSEGIQGQIEAIRKGYESEVEEAKAALARQRQINADLQQQHRKEVERLEAEIAEKVPEMVAAAAAQVEARCAARHSKEIADLKLTFELQRDKLKQECSDLQNIYTEKEARQRLQLADERVELEKLRQTNKTLQRRNEDLEEQVLELRRQLRVTSNTAHYLGGPSASAQRGRVSTNRSGVNMSFSRGGADFPAMLEHTFDGVRISREGYLHTPHGDPQEQFGNNENSYYGHNQQPAYQQAQNEEDPLMSHTVSFINDQLSFMKKQISSTLAPREQPSLPAAGLAGTTRAPVTMLVPADGSGRQLRML